MSPQPHVPCDPCPAALHVLVPVYNDWDAAWLLLQALDGVLAQARLEARVIVIDDGSTVPPPESLSVRAGGFVGVDILRLKRNLGHQRALAIALAWAAEHTAGGPVVVMDGDGEDDPADVPRLVARSQEPGLGAHIIFAERTRRSESLTFRVFYDLYRLFHYLVTGIPVRVGNFSLIPRSVLGRLAVVSELWNHYAAGVFRARLPRATMPTTRAKRLAGESRMNFVGLVVHGLSALSVHAEVAGVRLLVACAVAGGLTALLLVAVVAIKLFTDLAIPGWASTLSLALAILLAQFLGLALSFVFLILGSRSGAGFIPLRDYPLFVDTCSPVRLSPANA